MTKSTRMTKNTRMTTKVCECKTVYEHGKLRECKKACK